MYSGGTYYDIHPIRATLTGANFTSTSDQNIITIVASISPFRNGRDNARRLIEKDGKFYEIYVKASLKEVMRRDKKGLYKKFSEGKRKTSF